MNEKPKISFYKSTTSPFLVFIILFLVVTGLILFSFFGIIAFIVAGIFALIASAIRFIMPSKSKKFNNYNSRTNTLTLEEKDYEILDDDK
ncbi:MAG: hypothetical protein ACR2NC_03570 [Thermodesulfobacteriota bacterium]